MARLDPETRALLELSSKRGVSDADIADLLRLDEEEIAERRRRAEQRLAFELVTVDTRPEAAKRPVGRMAAAVVLAGAAVVAAVLLIVLGGGGEERKSASQRGAPAPEGNNSQRPAASAGPARAMERLNSTHGRGTAQLLRSGNGTRLRLRLSDFLTPRGGGYAVWLFNSRADARRLYATADTTINTDLPLPRGYRRYEFVDVARAVPRLTSAHSGLSLLRVRVAALAP
jgi:hypothetical protein